MLIPRLTAFAVATAALAWVSRASLAAPRSHGFYRFFAWEAIVGLLLLNLAVWFRDPLVWHQIISWLLLCVSGFLVLHGVRILRHLGRPDPNRAETPLIAFEKTTTVVTAGAYRYIRHPLYSSLLFLAWGIFFKDPSWPGAALALAATAFLAATARVEEAENVRFFGEDYQLYIRRTRMFIPYVF